MTKINIMNGRSTRLEDAVSKLSKDLKDTRQSLETKIDGVETKLKSEIRDLGNRMTALETR